MPQCCFKLLNDSLSTGLRFRFIGQTNQDPAYIISINSCLSVPHLYFTAMSSYLLENTEVLLHILDFAYVFFFPLCSKFHLQVVHLGKDVFDFKSQISLCIWSLPMFYQANHFIASSVLFPTWSLPFLHFLRNERSLHCFVCKAAYVMINLFSYFHLLLLLSKMHLRWLTFASLEVKNYIYHYFCITTSS